MELEELRRVAQGAVRPRRLSPSAEAGQVAAAIEAGSGAVFTGVCIDTACSMGFCAEHAAAAAMITAGESRVVRVVAVNRDGLVLPPCGRCREFLDQLHPDNGEARVLVDAHREVWLHELLPFGWQDRASAHQGVPASEARP